MRRTLLTGAGGFTGRYVARLLAEQGHEVHGVVHVDDGQAIEGTVRLFEADLADGAAIAEVVAAVNPDHVVHLAGIAFVGHSDVEQIYRSNVVGTRQLLEALAGLKKPPRSVLLASSANVYGNSLEGELRETTPFAPVNDYAASKVAMEFVTSLYRDRLPLTIVRPFNYTGKGQSSQFLIPKLINHSRERAAWVELGNLDVGRDFSDVRMVADVYSRLLDAPTAPGKTLNVCSGESITLQEILELVRSLSGHSMEVRVNPALVRSNEVRVLRGSKSALEEVIGPIQPIPMEETLRWMLEA
ncbi:NAD-dependent epimerase/dehydratase family protein [Sphingomonas limnosediminicola]|uniref:NAD-dependent epimerase/dehydratase family protein n=1 Tax=Sphingomonas limnosediminicola TaxID=940133 RepID=A0ABP7L8T5_9SPHN